MKLQTFDTKSSIRSRSNISCHHRGFDRDRPTSAKWIEKGSFVFPSGKSDECGYKVFFDRCITRFFSISTLMKRFSGYIKEDFCGIIDDKNKDVHLDPTRGIWSGESREDCILAYTLYRRRTLKCRTSRRCFDDNLFFSRKVEFPRDLTTKLMKAIEICDFFFRQIHIDTIRKSTSCEEFIYGCEISCSGDHTVLSDNIDESDFFTFSSYQGLESRLTSDRDSVCFWKSIFLCILRTQRM